MARTRQEALDEKRHQEQKSQHHAAKPPGDGAAQRRRQRGIWEKLEKENAGRRQDRAGKEGSQRRESVKCGLVFPGNGRG